jgi:signal transduction histidine kinase
MIKSLSSTVSGLMDLGTSERMKLEDAQRVRLTNILGFIPIGMYLVYIAFGLINKYYFPVILCSGLLILSVIGIFLNKQKHHGFAKFLLFSVNSASVLIAYNCLNIDYSICCYFFPILMAYEILYNLRLEIKRFIPAVGFTVICAVACFVLPKGILYYYEMSDELFKSSHLLNYILPFLISLFFMVIIMRMYGQTQSKLIEAKEEAEAAYKVKSDFLSSMSHELRTPLNGIIGSTNLLAHENISLSQKKYFDIIQYSSEHMLNLVNHILDFSKIEAGKLELDSNVFKIKEMVHRVADMFQNQVNSSDVTFIREIDDALDVSVVSDDLRLSQILHNFLSNAFKFTRRGTIILKASCETRTSNSIAIYFSVSDTGIGIKEDAQKTIFESFTQADTGTSRKFGGTGLGLSICKQLVEKFGSQIYVNSTYGKGSVFSFRLLLNTKTVHHKAEVEEPASTDTQLSDLRILVAEDNPVNMLLVRNFLKRWKATIVEVTNGEDAVIKHKQDDFDLILMDLEMPVMDGFTAIKEIRKLDQKIPVLAFTAALYDNMLNDLVQRGFNDFVHKPFRPHDLLSKIEQYKLRIAI